MADPQLDLKRWFRQKTEPHGVKARLSEVSGYTPTQISRMRNLDGDDPKKRQTIPFDMIEKAAAFFNELPPGFEGMTQWVENSSALKEVKGPFSPDFQHRRADPRCRDHLGGEGENHGPAVALARFSRLSRFSA